VPAHLHLVLPSQLEALPREAHYVGALKAATKLLNQLAPDKDTGGASSQLSRSVRTSWSILLVKSQALKVGGMASKPIAWNAASELVLSMWPA
jgi:hypothetical protein